MMNKILSFVLVLLVMTACKTKKVLVQEDMIPMDQKLAASTVNMNNIKSHIGFLASDELEGRDTGSEGLNVAAKYIETSLMRYGVKSFDNEDVDGFFQTVPMQKVSPPSAGSFDFAGQSIKFPDGFLMIRGGNFDVKGNIIYANRGSEADLEGLDLTGKVVVVSCGFEGEDSPQQWFYAGRTKREMVKEKGAAALVEIYSNAQLPYGFLKGYLNASRTVVNDEDEEKTFPHIWLNGAETDPITKLKASDGKSASISVGGMVREDLDTKNIVGYLEGSDPAMKDEYIIYSAHYDHVGIGKAVEGDSIYNGSRDNAVGTVTVLSAAENISKYPTKRSALFIFFTGEEKGLLGSAYYADHPVVPLDQMTYCFNSDNAGYNDTSKAMIIGLERTHADKFITKACTAFGLEAIKDNMPEQNLFDRSDNVNFAQKGVPAPTFGMGITAMDDEVNRYYHQPQDNPETLDYDYLVKFFKSYVYACRLIANTSESVFWKEGDKYYDAGVELYETKSEEP